MIDINSINWSDPGSKISNHFSVKEALWLPQWKRLANESDGLTDEIKTNLVVLCTQLDIVRDYFDTSMNIHCMLRPPAYNSLIGGAKSSAHMIGSACDFDVAGMSCKDAQDKILLDGMLDTWAMRMENNTKGGTVLPTWIHLDLRAPLLGHPRFFIP